MQVHVKGHALVEKDSAGLVDTGRVSGRPLVSETDVAWAENLISAFYVRRNAGADEVPFDSPVLERRCLGTPRLSRRR
jgi:hypothetical protein